MPNFSFLQRDLRFRLTSVARSHVHGCAAGGRGHWCGERVWLLEMCDEVREVEGQVAWSLASVYPILGLSN